ncbi:MULTISPECIES: LysR substrate-binding domain-containing protein [unclassified Psychrobacter]|uniref:LysR substrate-binding domain-containing protein n=3 Tax=Psychrobacter TaxID=497 RepID=UPI00178859E2|nr:MULTISPECIES: LysR substrate-binding domain-containing protein [unclassified Psychrobacter]MBE0443087.1 LysR family transcriptional regulator [Psychrobacter sp. FME13]
MDRLQAMSMFIKVVEVGSFSTASKELNVPLPTLSRKIAELENQLGVRLLHRTTRKLSLTDSGSAYIESCKRILEQVEEAEGRAKGEYLEPKGDLVITAPIMFGRLHVLPIVIEFLSLYPNINVQLLLSDRNVDLFEDDVDMAIRIGTLPDSTMIGTQVGTMRVVTCASQQFLLKQPELASPYDLTQRSCILLNTAKTTPHWRYNLPNSESTVHIDIFPRLMVNDSDSAVKAAVKSVGITQQLHYQVKRFIDNGDLKIILNEFEPDAVPIHLLHKTRKYLPQKMKVFLEFIVPALTNSIGELSAAKWLVIGCRNTHKKDISYPINSLAELIK